MPIRDSRKRLSGLSKSVVIMWRLAHPIAIDDDRTEGVQGHRLAISHVQRFRGLLVGGYLIDRERRLGCHDMCWLKLPHHVVDDDRVSAKALNLSALGLHFQTAASRR